MEQTPDTSSSHLPSFFSPGEKEVAEILLNLPSLIYKSEFHCRWGARRKRTLPDSSPSPPRRLRPPPSSPSLPQLTCPRENETERRVEVSSPTTPLFFSASESDGILKDSRRKRTSSKKRTREELLVKVDQLSRNRDFLKGEIETVKSYYRKIKDLNMKLKATKHKLSSGHGDPRLEISKMLTVGLESAQLPIQSELVEIQVGSHTRENFLQDTYQASSSSGLDRVNHMDPLDIPYLLEYDSELGSSQPLDQRRSLPGRRAEAAEARKRRMVIMKETGKSFAAKPLRC